MPAAHLTCPAGKPFVVIHLNLDISYYGRRMLGGTVLGDTVRSSRVCDCRRFSRARDCRLACSASKTSCPTARPARIGHQSIGNTICAPKYKAIADTWSATHRTPFMRLPEHERRQCTHAACIFSYPRSTLDTETRCRSISAQAWLCIVQRGSGLSKGADARSTAAAASIRVRGADQGAR